MSSAKKTPGKVVSPISKKRRNNRSLRARVARAKKRGKVVDVSNITMDGTGTKTLYRPNSSEKVGPRNLAMVSNNSISFEIALMLLGEEYSCFIAKWPFFF